MRLTEKKDSGSWCLRDVPWDQMKPGAVLTQKTWEKLYGALWKLKDYEDTGKSPEEIECMDNDMQVTAKGMLKRVAELSAEVDRMKAEGFWIMCCSRFPTSYFRKLEGTKRMKKEEHFLLAMRLNHSSARTFM